MTAAASSISPTFIDAGMIHVCGIDELKTKRQVVVRGADRPIVVFYNDGCARAVDNRCPHMGFPLHKGTCENGMITCHWHHARFDAASGCTFDLFADDVPAYDTHVTADGQVYVAPRPRQRDAVKHGFERLREGMQQNIGLIQAKSILTLRGAGVSTADIVREAALFGVRNRDAWSAGLTALTALANLAPDLSDETAFLALYQGVRMAAANTAGQAPRRPRKPLETDELALDRLDQLLRYWTGVRHRDGAERTMLTAVSNGASMQQLTRLIFSAATERYYAGGGHVLDFANKAFELLELIGPELADEVLPSLMADLVASRGGEELNAWRHPIDLVPLIQQATDQLERSLSTGRGKTWHAEAELAHCILSDDPGKIIGAILGAIESGARAHQLSKSLAYAAGMRVARFGTSNEIGDWFTALHTFTYCNALHQAIKRGADGAPSALLRGVLHGAMSVYLDRFLNVPPARLPGERKSIDDLPTDAKELRQLFLDALDSQHQVDRAARVVARYVEQGHELSALVDTMTYAVIREDFDFHTLQMIEAAARQCREWGQAPQAGHILIAAARYLAAFSPTQRAQLQTARIALRLHRGEEIYTDETDAPAAS